jgi:RHS repeat-associated protein
VKKTAAGKTTIYHYDLEGNLIAETASDGKQRRSYIYAGANRLAMVDGSGNLFYYHNDHLGTPLAMTNSGGNVVWKAAYDPFGEAQVDPASTVTNNFRFPGQYYDEESGLHYNWHRYYDPRTGRYVKVDSLRSLFIQKNKSYFIVPLFKSLPSRLLPYVYAQNNPIVVIDQEGLFETQKPGCDEVPNILETKFVRSCCDDHDWCYTAFRCSQKSFKLLIPGNENKCGENPWCKYCNSNVIVCITKCFLTLQGPGEPFGGPSVTEPILGF